MGTRKEEKVNDGHHLSTLQTPGLRTKVRKIVQIFVYIDILQRSPLSHIAKALTFAHKNQFLIGFFIIWFAPVVDTENEPNEM